MSRSLFPRRGAPSARVGKQRFELKISKKVMIALAIAIAVVACVMLIKSVYPFHGIAMPSKPSTVTRIIYVTLTKTVTKLKTLTITNTVTETFVPNYVSPHVSIELLGLRYDHGIPCIDLKYNSTSYVMIVVNTSKGEKFVYSLPPVRNGHSCLAFAAPCEPITNSTLSIEVKSLLGKVLMHKMLIIGNPNVSASLIQYVLNPENPHTLQHLELQIVNYGTGPAEISKIVMQIFRGSTKITERRLFMGCLYVASGSSKLIYTPELSISLPSGKYKVYIELLNSNNKVLFKGFVGDIIIG